LSVLIFSKSFFIVSVRCLQMFVCYCYSAVARGSWRWTQQRIQRGRSDVQLITNCFEFAVLASVCVLVLISSGTRQLEVDTVEATEKAFQCSANHKLL
jgi:hypothetical protein